MSEILTSIAQPMRYLIELDTPLVLKKNSGMLMEGDVEANTVVLEVFKTRDVPADLSGITFSLYFTRPDGNTLQPIAGTVEENTVRLTLTGGCYKYTGQYTMLVTMKKGEENRTVLKATGHMEGRNTENMIDPEGTFPTPEELLEMLNVLDEALQSANTATENATAAATRANNAAAGIETVTATATELAPNEEATAQVIKGESGMHFSFGIPRGEKGEKGEKGEPGTAENVTIDSIAGLREALNSKQPKGDYLPADGTAEDASKLGGRMPEEYLAADGTAADASKLGGVAAAEYATKKNLEQYATKEDLENIDIPTGGTANVAYNLLDNSSFKNPVNQRRADGTISAIGYFIDRWKLISGSVTVGADGLTLNGEIAQILENAPAGNVTAAASAGTASFDAETNTFSLTASGELIEWAALYEGEYTAENMPTYVPKEYAVEFLECQRYFVTFNNYGNYLIPIASGYIANTNTARLLIRLPLPMRTNPTFGAFNVPANGIQVRAGNSVYEGATITVLGKTENGVVIHCVLPSGKTTTAHDTMSLGFAPSSGGTAYLYFSADL